VSFRLKTIIGIAVIEAVLLAILVVSGLRWLRDSNEAQLVQRGATTAQLFATTAKDAVLATDLASLESFVQEALKNPGIAYARVLDGQGRVLAEGGDSAALARAFVADTDPSRAEDGVFDTDAEISEAGIPFGRVELGLSVEAFRSLLREARSFGVGIAALEMLLVALFSFVLGTYLTRQLGRLQGASERIAREGPGFRIPVEGRDEVARAVAAFNAMSARLAESNAEQRRALEQSRELAARITASETQKAAMLDAALDAIITIDLEGRVVEYNTSAEQTFGFTREEAVGRRLDELIIPEEHRSAHSQGMERFRESGLGPVLGQRIELPALHKSGKRLPLEIAITHVETDQGHYFTAFMRDISDRIRAEEELRLAASAFEAQEAIFITDADARILRVNRAFTAITGHREGEVVGLTPRVLKSGRQDGAFYRAMWERLVEEGHWEGEIENRRKDGEVFPEWLSITAVRDAQGRTTNYVAHFIDISERKRNEAALETARARAERASEAKSRFLATMSHEIRTPLNAIINMNELLLETALDSEQRTYAATASEAGRGLLSIVNSILDFSKIEAGRTENRPEPCEPEEIAGGVVRLLAARAFAKGIELTLYVDPGTPGSFKTDPGLLRQILLNLVGNAVKFTETGGVRLRVSLEAAGDGDSSVRFDVVDTGIGIPEDRQPDLFKEFTQVDDSSTRRFGGTGLGLSISRALARLLGGEVGFESRHGQGSRFWLRLPAADMKAAAPPAGSLPRRLGGRAALIQSPSPILAEEIRLQLTAVGLTARVVDRLPGAPVWLGDPGCAGGIALAGEEGPEPGNGSAGGGAPLIRLMRTGERAGSGPRVPGAPLSGRLPIVPRALYRLLGEAAGEPPEVCETPAGPGTPAPAPPPKAGAGAPPILLVEDSRPNRLVAEAILSKAGYRVEMAENGLEAVSAVKQKGYGLVLMDVAMPEMDGLEATRAIRALAGAPGRVPIVAMTAGAFGEDRQQCLEAGMDDHLSKPVVRAELMRAVERWLKRGEAP
jgi:PAS domain S-box-containing protein